MTQQDTDETANPNASELGSASDNNENGNTGDTGDDEGSTDSSGNSMPWE